MKEKAFVAISQRMLNTIPALKEGCLMKRGIFKNI